MSTDELDAILVWALPARASRWLHQVPPGRLGEVHLPVMHLPGRDA